MVRRTEISFFSFTSILSLLFLLVPLLAALLLPCL